MPVRLNSSGGGSVTLDVPSTGSTFNLTMPAITGTAVAAFSNGNVGIGTASPASTLAVAGTISVQDGPVLFPIQPMLTAPSGRTRVTFGPTGALQSFTVPAGITTLLAKLWGAGGGGGSSGGWTTGARGGGGGHTIGIIPTTPGTVYHIVVGLPGQTNYSGGQTPRYGGGGGMFNNTDNRYCGSGGGYTGIFSSSTLTQGNAIMIAGGGGGGGCTRMNQGTWGGAGGGTTGEAGSAPYDGRLAAAGGGGTQSGGGAAGTTQNTQGTAGSALTGGYGASNAYGGGGGGGFFGGGGGGYFESNTMAGGGGGSGYFNPSLTRYAATFTGTQFMPAMYQDGDLPNTYDGFNNWQHYAVGGDIVISASQYTSTGGGGGFCVIYY